MLLPVVIILVSARPAFFAQVNKRELMEGTLQKYVEEFMAFYGNHTRTSEPKPLHKLRTVFSEKQARYNQSYKSRQKDQASHNVISKKKKKLITGTHTKKRQSEKQTKIRPKSQIKAISQQHKPHGHAYEFDGAFDPFPLWEYSGWRGFEFWPSAFPRCGGPSQSPINIDRFKENTNRRLVVHRSLPRLHFHGYSKVTSATTKLLNTGRALVVDVDEGVEGLLSGGPLPEEYVLLQLHFHWGSYNGIGAEHTVDRHRYPVELHLVHIASSLGRGKSAVSPREVEGGLAVVAIHFQLAKKGSPALSPLLDSLQYIRPAGKTFANPYEGFQLSSLMNPISRSNFFSYEGSLTTPACNQVVRWIVMDDQLPIGFHQIDQLRSLWDRNGDPLVDNFRPTQPLNNRTVEYIEQWP